MRDKFNPKWRCKGCGCLFEKRDAHGCLDKEEWIKLNTEKKGKIK